MNRQRVPGPATRHPCAILIHEIDHASLIAYEAAVFNAVPSAAIGKKRPQPAYLLEELRVLAFLTRRVGHRFDRSHVDLLGPDRIEKRQELLEMIDIALHQDVIDLQPRECRAACSSQVPEQIDFREDDVESRSDADLLVDFLRASVD